MDQAIYVMRSAGRVKIGISKRPLERRHQLQTALTESISLDEYWSIDGGLARDVERRAHNILKDRLIVGEWFDAGISDAVSAVMQAASELGLTLTPFEAKYEPYISVRLDKGLKKAFEDAARRQRQTVSGWLLQAGIERMAREGRDLPERPPRDKDKKIGDL